MNSRLGPGEKGEDGESGQAVSRMLHSFTIHKERDGAAEHYLPLPAAAVGRGAHTQDG